MPLRVRRDAARVLAPSDAAAAHSREWEASALTPRALAMLSATARAAVERRLALIQTRGRATFDLVQELAQPLWPDLLAGWCGLAEQQRRRLHHLSRAVRLVLAPGELSAAGVRSAIDALDELHRIFSGGYRQPRQSSAQPSLFAALEVNWTPALGPIEDAIAVASMRLLLAGSALAPVAIGELVEMLVDDHERVAELHAQPAEIAAFVAIVVRRCAPSPTSRRAAPHDDRTDDCPASPSESLARMQATALLEALLSRFERIDRAACGTAAPPDGSPGRFDHLVLRIGACPHA